MWARREGKKGAREGGRREGGRESEKGGRGIEGEWRGEEE